MRKKMGNTGRTIRLAMVPAAAMLASVWSSEGRADAAAAMPPARNEAPRSSPRFADGVYTATGQYGGRPSFITVTVRIADGIISDVTVIPRATVPQSLELQQRFAAAVPRVVVGKRIDEVKVDKLAGSSGTPVGFNAALDQIKRQAAIQ